MAAPSLHGSVEIEIDLEREWPVLGEWLCAVPGLVCQGDLRAWLALLPAPVSEVRRRAVRSRLGWWRRSALAQDCLAVAARTVDVVDDGPVVAEAAVDPVAGAVTGKDAIVACPTRHDVLPVTSVEDVVAAHSS